jgi:hypothetical protein
MRKRILLLGVMLSGLSPAAFGIIITNGTFNIAGQIYVTGAGGVTVPGVGVCPLGVQCIFWQDTGSPALNNKVDISTGGLPNGNLPLGMAGNDAANIVNMTNPPEIVDGIGFAPQPFMSFNNGGVTTQLLLTFIAPGIDGPAGCAASPPAAEQFALRPDRCSICRI